MKAFVKEWRLQIILLVVIIIGIGLVETQGFWGPRVYGEYILYRMRNAGLTITPQPETLSATVASGAKQTLDTITFQLPWSVATNTKLSTTTSLWLTNQNENKIIVFARGKSSYDAYVHMLTMTPSDARIFDSTAAFNKSINTLEQKRSTLFGKSNIYSFETNNGVRGFLSQISATSSAAELFTPSGNEYEFAFSNLSKDQIDQTLQSIKEAK